MRRARRAKGTTEDGRRTARRGAPRAALAALALALLPGASPAPPGAPPLPPIAFVSRSAPEGAAAGLVPGLGPSGRTLGAGGRLLLREPDGRVRALLPAERFFDVSDPCVSPDGRRIAFAALAAPGARWRLWSVRVDGTSLRPLTDSTAGIEDAPGADDFDPCWISDGEIVFASTRYPQRGEYDDGAVSNLFLLGLPVRTLARLTSERNGAEEPAFDPARGRLLFSRWWFNRHRPAGRAAGSEVAGADTVNLWLAMEMPPHGGAEHVAAGDPRARRGAMGYQAVALPGGALLGVAALNSGLSPAPGACGIQRLERRGADERRVRPGARVAGAAFDPEEASAYGGTRGLAAPSALAPAALPGARIVYALDPGARGDFGLWTSREDGSGAAPLLDLPATLELDPAPVVAWTEAQRARTTRERARFEASRAAGPDPLPGRAAPAVRLDEAAAVTFRYQNRDVFEGAGAPPRAADARLRFYATLARPALAGGDTAVLVREAPVGRDGRVDVAPLPAHTPMFEELVDAAGRVLQGSRGPAHVAGLNVAPAGAIVRCAGCHVGHSLRVRPPLGN